MFRQISDDVVHEDPEQSGAENTSLWDSFFQCLLLAVLSIQVNSGFLVIQVLADPLEHAA